MSSTVVKVKDVSIANHLLTVWLSDGRILSLPLTWYPSLSEATIEERSTWQVSGAGRGIHWPSVDYDLSVEGLLAGCHEHPSALTWTRKTRARNQLADSRLGGRKPTRKKAAKARV